MGSDREYRAVHRFVESFRPVLTDCDTDKCVVFPVRKDFASTKCCSPILTENVNTVLKKAFKRAGADSKHVGSTLIRKVLVSVLRGDEQDPALNLAIANAACHSLDTSNRYYDITMKDKPFISVSERLRERFLQSSFT